MKSFYTTPLLLFADAANALPKYADRSPPSQTLLEWAPCELEGIPKEDIKVSFDCAKLPVPLDYTNPNSDELLPLQLVKVNATKEPVLGSVLFNPGGPGSSATEDLVKVGDIYGEVLGGQYDLIGFDPRGTGRTIPFSCAINWTEAPSAADLKPRSELLHQDLVEVLETEGWKDSTYVSKRCLKEQSKNGRFLSTAFVARDMVQIIDALDEDGKLRFWGMSYGTLLGQTFAAMFPERVDRMVLDSVVDGPDYMAGYWLPALKDTEKTLKGFFEECISSGPKLCPIADLNGPDTTAADLLSALNSALEALLAKPLPAAHWAAFTWNPSPSTTLYTSLKAFIFSALYHATQYPILAETMYPLLTQNFTALLETPPTPPTPPPSVPWNMGAPDAFWGTACTDSSYRANSSGEMHDLVRQQEAVSGMVDGFIGKTWPCAQWKMTAAERYAGTFETKTNFPILFVNGAYDPCTPLSSAMAASDKFENSAVLTHGGHGHKFIRHPSICTTKAVRAYFVEGKFPERGAFCEPDLPAFEVAGAGGPGAGNETARGLKERGVETEEDLRLLRRMLENAARNE